jgi:hypothetical protein
MDYAVRATGAFISFAILSGICFLIDRFTTIRWYEIMAVISLWFTCKANLDMSVIEAATRNFMEKVIILLVKSDINLPEFDENGNIKE